MSDIVEQLRQASLNQGDYRWQAADEIERLRAEVETWVRHAKTAIWSDSEECKLLTADNERLRAELNGRRTGLRVVMVAASLLDQEDLPDEPSVILCGSIEAIHNLGELLGDRVDILPTNASLEGE